MIMSSMMRTHSSILPGFTGYLRTSVKACAQRSVNAHGFEREQKHGAEAKSSATACSYPWGETADGEAGGRGRGGHMVDEGI